MISCVKVLSDMDIAEKRKPLDGSFMGRLSGRTLDFRVATTPSVHGETMAIRILDRDAGLIRLEKLGLLPDHIELARRIIQYPHGMLIVSGPTGAGKSTTLYAMLSEIDAYQKNIITIEDPIEYRLDNVTQTPINPKAGVTFASSLRSMLRQDPDVIMVGEIRDAETARVACQAAMTGHFVFTTLHANDSVTSLFRLLDLGVEPYFIASSLSAVLAQRLVPRALPGVQGGLRAGAGFLQEHRPPAGQGNPALQVGRMRGMPGHRLPRPDRHLRIARGHRRHQGPAPDEPGRPGDHRRGQEDRASANCMRTAWRKSSRESRRSRNCSESHGKGGPAIGYFFSVASLVITLYWIYRGLRRGLYPALNILFVFFVPLLLTLNYYDLLFGVVARIKPDTTPTTRETISFIGTYLVTFFICVYFCLWLCAEDLRMDKTMDTIAGGILGTRDRA